MVRGISGRLEARFERVLDDLEDALDRGASVMQSNIRRRAPRARGELKKDVRSQKLYGLDGLPYYRIWVDNDYGKFVEEGTGPGTPNPAPKGPSEGFVNAIKTWMRAKPVIPQKVGKGTGRQESALTRSAYAIAREKSMLGDDPGTAPNPFFSEGVEMSEPVVDRLVKNAFQRSF